MQPFETLVTENLNVGTQRVWIPATTGGKVRATQVGIHTLAIGQHAWTKTWNPGTIAAGSYAATTVTVTGVSSTSIISASHDQMLTNDLRIRGHFNTTDTVTVIIHNPTASSVTVASGTVSVLAFDGILTLGIDPPVAGFSYTKDAESTTVNFTNTSTGDGLTYVWTFESGTPSTSTQANPAIDWPVSPGTATYAVTMTATNAGGSDIATLSYDYVYSDSQSGTND